MIDTDSYTSKCVCMCLCLHLCVCSNEMFDLRVPLIIKPYKHQGVSQGEIPLPVWPSLEGSEIVQFDCTLLTDF